MVTGLTRQAEPEEGAGEDTKAPSARGPAPKSWRHLPRGQRWPTLALYVLAVVPVLYVLHRVHKAPALPYTDYWQAFARIFTPSGGLHVGGIFSYQNEHPFVVPSLLYYIDAKFFDGTNQFTGYVSVVLALVTVLLARRMLPESMSAPMRAFMTMVISVVLFSPSGLWNFVRGMSGSAWLSANVFALAAILLAWRGRSVSATLVAALAILSYGTGFGAPIAIGLIALVRRDRWWRWALPAALLLGAAIVYAATATGGTTGANSRDPALIGSTFLSNLGMLWDPSAGPTAIIAGAAGLLLIGWSFWTVRADVRYADLLPWWGVAIYSICAAGLISVARGSVFGGDGVQGRYASLSGLFWIAVTVIAVRVVMARQESSLRIGAMLSMIAVFVAVSPTLAGQAISLEPTQRLTAAALRFNATGPVRNNVIPIDQVVPRLKALGDYPFTSSYSVGCGRKPGDTVTATSIRPLPASYADGTNGAVEAFGTPSDGALRFTGWIRRGGSGGEPSCVLVLDRDGKIVGGGVTRIPRADLTKFSVPSSPVGYDAVAPAALSDVRVVLGFADGFWQLPPS